MGPGRFSITVNRATPQGRPTMDWSPSTLARYVLEQARDYARAVELLSQTPLRTPAVFTLAAADGKTACVVERTRKGCAVRELTGRVLVAANHYLTPALAQFNTTPALVDLSQAQVRLVSKLAEKLTVTELGDVFDVLGAEGVVTDTTCQQLAFAPTDGLYCAVGRVA
jgi:predicted choloylglycine hydrolase